MITILDFGMGNLRSVQKAFERLGVSVEITTSPEGVVAAQKLVLPGVGHFAKGMQVLIEKGLDQAIRHVVIKNRVPILGICLGMQLLTNFSQEGNAVGLGLVDAEVMKFHNIAGLKIPHMGWNTIQSEKSSRIFDGLFESNYFYFVHSYYVKCNDPRDRLFVTSYGNCFDSGFQKDHIVGVQFHPEKSHKPGLRLLKNFAGL
ncbi:MAG: imidazole glycerol phosphate synthase subunit HisH [Desulfobacterales bacterium]|nr:imidazole glycerol phosphate synthase subunit HisH [Desulfobacterales bacterium]